MMRILEFHLGASVLARKLDREALPSLLPTFAQHCLPPLRFHAGAETMFFDSPLVPRTVGRLTHL